MLRLKSVIGVVLLLCLLLASRPTFAQDAFTNGEELPLAPPAAVVPMENVFYNTLWGGVLGGALAVSATLLDNEDTERYQAAHQFDQFAIGATGGAFIGAAVGLYLTWNGIEFDANRSRIAENDAQESDPQYHVPLNNPKKAIANIRDLRKISGVPLFIYHRKF